MKYIYLDQKLTVAAGLPSSVVFLGNVTDVTSYCATQLAIDSTGAYIPMS
jgi:hypothetical protein